MKLFWKSWILTYCTLRSGAGCGQNICYQVAIFRGRKGSAGKIFATILLHLWFSLIWYAIWPCPEKNNFDSIPRIGGEVGVGGQRVSGQNICYQVAVASWFSLIWYATWPCSEKVKFWSFDPNSRVGGGGGGGSGGVCGQNICYHAAAFVKFFNWICNMTMFWKSWSLTYWTPS